ncbi:MAG: hypothetical protein CMJ94_05535 [Planctomycetes bacterium]|nr:hypothetical protein [Planctomycetota bacterium]
MVFEGQDDLGQNEAFEHLARHMGQHFDLLAPFYEKMKRAVATGKTTRVDIESYSEQERSAAVQLGTLLYRHGMLKDFYYHRSPKKQLRVIPNKDGEIQQFLTGGWLEIYVVWLLSRRLRARMSPAKYQVMFNVKGTLPDEREFESDLMACIDGRLLWLECKTGQWQDYSARFRGLVKTFGTDRAGAGLVLIKPPDGSTRGRATDMLDMTLLSLGEVAGFIDDFLGVPADERLDDTDRGSSGRRRGGRGRGRDQEGSNDRTAPLPVGVIPPKSEDEIPLENPEPAKKLGKVDLEAKSDKSESSKEEDGVPRRRRRRRRGGRGRGGSGGNDSQGSSESTSRSSLREELPVSPIDEEAAEELEAKQTSAEVDQVEAEAAEAQESEATQADAEGKDGGEDKPRRRRRGSRGGRRRKKTEDGEQSEEAEAEADAEVEAEAVAPSELEPEAEVVETAAQADPEEDEADEEVAEPAAPAAEAPAIPAGMVVKRPDWAPEAKTETPERKKPEAAPRVPRTERKGSVIAPDLSAMLAGGSKDDTSDAGEEEKEAEA